MFDFPHFRNREKVVGEADGRITITLWYLLFAFTFYIAATGPLVKLARAGKIPEGWLVIYYPLQDVINGTPLEEALRWYVIKVWKVKDD